MDKTTFQHMTAQYINEPYARNEAERLQGQADSHRDYANQIEKFDPEAAGIMRAAAEAYAEGSRKQMRLIEHFRGRVEKDLLSSVNRLANELVGYRR